MTLRDRIAAIIGPLPPGASVTLPVDTLRAWLETDPAEAPRPEPTPAPTGPPASWRERLWVIPAETRLSVQEAAEALGKSKSWIYKRTMAKAGDGRLPCRKDAGGELVFVAGELRAWIRDHEEPLREWTMDSTPAERAAWRVVRGGRS